MDKYRIEIFMSNPAYPALIKHFQSIKIQLFNDHGFLGGARFLSEKLTFQETQKIRDSAPENLRSAIRVIHWNVES